MNIQSKGTVMVLAKNVREGSNRQFYYNLAILTEGQAGNISCTPEAYDKAVIAAENEVIFAFNDQYKSFRVVDVIPAPYVPEIPDDMPDAKPDDKTDNAPDTKPDDKTDNAPDTKPDEKTDNTPDTKPDSKTDKPGNKPDGRAAK